MFKEIAFGQQDSHLERGGTKAEYRIRSFQRGHTVPVVRKGQELGQAFSYKGNQANNVPYPQSASSAVSSVTVQGVPKSQLVVRFHVPPDQRNFYQAVVYVKGYKGNSNYVNMGTFTASPAILLLDKTGETLQLRVSASNKAGKENDFARATGTAARLA